MADPRASALLTLSEPLALDERWVSVQATLGIQFPRSFIAVIDAFGATTWNEFLFVPSPLEAKYQDWLTRTLDAERTLRQSFPQYYPLALFPEAGGLYPWAVSDNGDVFFWITQRDPEHWPTVIKDARAPEFEAHFSPSHLVLHRVATGSLRSSILPSDL